MSSHADQKDPLTDPLSFAGRTCLRGCVADADPVTFQDLLGSIIIIIIIDHHENFCMRYILQLNRPARREKKRKEKLNPSSYRAIELIPRNGGETNYEALLSATR